MRADMWAWTFWPLFLVWQGAPAILIWRARIKALLSVPAAVVAAAIAAFGTAAFWYMSYTDSSSTAPAVLMFSPLYLLGAVLLVCFADFGVRAAGRGLRRR